MNKQFVLALLASVSLSQACEQQESLTCTNERTQEYINKASSSSDSAFLYHDSEGFHFFHEGEKYDIQNCFVDPILRKVTAEQFQKLSEVSHFRLVRMSNGEYALKNDVRGLGGGPALGAIFYLGTKGLLYAGVIGAVGGAAFSVGWMGAATGIALPTAGPLGASLAASATTAAVTGIESASVAAGAFGLAIPWF